MSDDDESSRSSSSDESEDITTTGLVATRAKRKSAGNRYEATLGEYDDPELQALFAEADGESDDYESSDPDADDDDAMDSSSSDEDAGPPKAGEQEDLEGEKELKKAERAEQNRKRKAQQAKLTVPAFAKKVKRVQLAEQVQIDDGSSSAIEVPLKKKQQQKKVERRDWRLSAEDLPTRQSTRASAVAFRENIHDNLKDAAERSRKHKKALHETMTRERGVRRKDLTTEDRLEKCRGIEKETAKELGRFEREEAERVRLREEALMAKRRRVLDGPLIRTLSTSGLYENGKLKVKRLLHGSQPVHEMLAEQEQAEREHVGVDTSEYISTDPPAQQALAPTGHAAEDIEADQAAVQQLLATSDHSVVVDVEAEQAGSKSASPPVQPAATTPARAATEDVDMPVETGADESSHQTETAAATDVTDGNPSSHDHSASTMVDNKHEAVTIPDNTPGETAQSKPVDTQQVQAPVPWLSGINEYATPPAVKVENDQHSENTTQGPIIPEPLVREQAQRHVIMLEDFPSLEGVTKRTKATSVLEPTAVAQLLMPDSYPTFTDDEAAYLRKTRKLKQELHPKPLCALTSWEGKYRDPKTGIVYADVPAYKMLQRLIAGGCNWNSMLQCWSAPFVGMIGRPAHGVPEGFEKPLTKPIP